MKIGVLGTGAVGTTIANKLVELGHEVRMGAREVGNVTSNAWVISSGPNASAGSFADAAAYGDWIFNCTKGTYSLDVLKMAGAENLAGKILIDLANPLDFGKGMPPTLTICNDTSLGEQIQAAYPDTKVVKVLNTVTCPLMVAPHKIPGDHDLFMSGNDAPSKKQVSEFLKREFGWKVIIDLGDITNARGTEMYLALWVRLYGSLKTPEFNIHVIR